MKNLLGLQILEQLCEPEKKPALVRIAWFSRKTQSFLLSQYHLECHPEKSAQVSVQAWKLFGAYPGAVREAYECSLCLSLTFL
jgi:hypothetical protein